MADRNSILEEAAKIAERAVVLDAMRGVGGPRPYGVEIAAEIRALKSEDRKPSDLERCALESRHLWDDGYAASDGAVNDSWVLVPREPTEAMLDGADRARALPEHFVREIYAAMLAAVPTPSGSGDRETVPNGTPSHEPPDLEARLKSLAGTPMTPEAIRAQRISYITGLTGIDKASVADWLDRHEGRAKQEGGE